MPLILLQMRILSREMQEILSILFSESLMQTGVKMTPTKHISEPKKVVRKPLPMMLFGNLIAPMHKHTNSIITPSLEKLIFQRIPS